MFKTPHRDNAASDAVSHRPRQNIYILVSHILFFRKKHTPVKRDCLVLWEMPSLNVICNLYEIDPNMIPFKC